MFRCLKCGKSTSLPQCGHCGYMFDTLNGIYQLTADPNANLEGDKGVKYLGYDRVGPYYSGKDRLKCQPLHMLIAEKVAELINRGVLLDVGCGDGAHAVPAVLHGCTVIAGDISNVMLEMLLEKAAVHQANLDKLVPCRMNALSIPLIDNCVDGVMVNSVLHLISQPMIVIREIYRVLKPGRKLILFGNSPGLPDDTIDYLKQQNEEYMNRVGKFHQRYWELIKAAGVPATRYSWKFDQKAACDEVFGNSTHINITFAERNVSTLSDGFLYRMGGKGFSDQQGVPDDLHEKVFAQVVDEFKEEYGPDFDQVTCVSIRSGIVLHVYEKTDAAVRLCG